MASHYTLDDVSLLIQIRTDILAHPNAYRDGESFLRAQHGPEHLRRDALAHWEEFKDHPTEKAAHRAAAKHQTKAISDPTEREERYREILEGLAAPPSESHWTPGACACQAIQGLRNAQGGEHHDIKAKAVLILAVMLWDADADKRHQIFTLFGPWGATAAGDVESIARWAATYFLQEEADLRHWMNTVRMAWTALPRSADPAVVAQPDAGLTEGAVVSAQGPRVGRSPEASASTVSIAKKQRPPARGKVRMSDPTKPIDPRVDLLSLSDFQKRVFTKAGRYVIAHRKPFAEAGKRLDRNLAAWQRENKDRHPDEGLLWAVGNIISDMTYKHFPAGNGAKEHALRLVYLALVAFYPPGAKNLGPIACREWDGDIIAHCMGLGGLDDWPGGPVPKDVRRRWRENARNSFAETEPARRMGREVIMFCRDRDAEDALCVGGNFASLLDPFAKVVNKALAVLGAGTVAEPVERPATGASPVPGDTPAPVAQVEAAAKPTTARLPAPKLDRSCTVAALREMTGLRNTALNKYAKMAGVPTPLRGKRNHKYTTDETQRILRRIINTSGEDGLRERCQDALKSLTNPAKIA